MQYKSIKLIVVNTVFHCVWCETKTHASVTGDAGNAPKRQTETMTFQTKLNCLISTKQLESAAVAAHHFKINKSSVRTIIKKKKERKGKS